MANDLPTSTQYLAHLERLAADFAARDGRTDALKIEGAALRECGPEARAKASLIIEVGLKRRLAETRARVIEQLQKANAEGGA